MQDITQKIDELINAQNFDEAAALAGSELLATEAAAGEDSLEAVRARLMVTDVLLAKGDAKSASKELEKAVAITEKIDKIDTIEATNCLRGLAWTRTNVSGNAKDGVKLFKKRISELPETSRNFRHMVLYLVEFCAKQDMVKQAEILLDENGPHFGLDDPDLNMIVNVITGEYLKAGDTENAFALNKKYFDRIVDTKFADKLEMFGEVADRTGSLAAMYRQGGQEKEADDLYTQVLDTFKDNPHFPSHESVDLVKDTIMMKVNYGKTDEAKELIQERLDRTGTEPYRHRIMQQLLSTLAASLEEKEKKNLIDDLILSTLTTQRGKFKDDELPSIHLDSTIGSIHAFMGN
ncbi:MAG: hypothetical protein KAR06_04740, partial [Deltaproteobacteria bacterium]|nr:hypothetical protein [Deltaproteobacteria bacterium]